MNLAPYAIDSVVSRGRRYDEPPPAWRTEFQRDRDRVIHSSAFRRLEYKTQVFVNHEGDMFRTRLTHSLEVAQIARTVARAIAANEDLTEAIALAHDLGHTPFGHAGQDALNRCMRPFGGFEHNLHSLRVVDELERRYPQFEGLNLMFETREGILKHCSRDKARALGDVGERFVRRRQPSIEAQIANVADEIAYNHHDIDDGLRSGILSVDDVLEHDLFRRIMTDSGKAWPGIDRRRHIHTAIRTMLGAFVTDLIEATKRRLELENILSVDDVRDYGTALVDFSGAKRDAHVELKRILRIRLYEDERVQGFAKRADAILSGLFSAFMEQPQRLPADRRRPDESEGSRARIISDYIAGMTDRFALAEHVQIHGRHSAGSLAPWLVG
jgi:dGTPase